MSRPFDDSEGGGDTAARSSEPARGAARAGAKPKLQKVTLYVRPEQILALEEIQLRERRRTGRRPDKSDLVQEALDLLIQKHSKE
jgi:hypothetical protein